MNSVSRMVSVLGILILSACAQNAVDDLIDETVVLTIENRSGAELWYFQYADCGGENRVEVIADDEFVANGSDVSSFSIEPGCYDLFVEDEFACTSTNSTDGNLAGGLEFTWTLVEADLSCP